MKRLLRASSFVLLTLSGIGLSVVAVRASTDCERYIRVFHARTRHHKVSPETLARWTAWNKAHPHYHPHKLGPKETWEKVSFACEVPIIEKTADLQLPPSELPPLEMLPPDLFQPSTPEITEKKKVPVFEQEPPTETLLIPPTYTAEIPTLYGPTIPTSAAVPPPPIGATPEPGSLWLMGTSLLCGAGLMWKRKQRAVVRA